MRSYCDEGFGGDGEDEVELGEEGPLLEGPLVEGGGGLDVLLIFAEGELLEVEAAQEGKVSICLHLNYVILDSLNSLLTA